MKATDDGMNDSRANRQIRLVERITKITTRLVPEDEGVDLVYINSDGMQNARAPEIKKTMMETRSDYATPIGTELRKKILNPQVYEILKQNKEFSRPLLISIITDGEPNNEDDEEYGSEKVFERVVSQCIDKLKANHRPEYCEYILRC
jgi:hypothetical protein